MNCSRQLCFLNQRERKGHRWNCNFLSFCRFEIEEHHKKGKTTPVDQWKRRELSKQELEIMYKEASGIREKSVSSDGWGIACKNEHRDWGVGVEGGYSCCLYYILFRCVSLDFLWTMCSGACGGSDSRFSECEQVPWSDCNKVYARRCCDQIMMFICASTMVGLWWSLCMLVPWSDCDKVCVCRYHDHIVMRFTCTGAMIRF